MGAAVCIELQTDSSADLQGGNALWVTRAPVVETSIPLINMTMLRSPYKHIQTQHTAHSDPLSRPSGPISIVCIILICTAQFSSLQELADEIKQNQATMLSKPPKQGFTCLCACIVFGRVQ